MSLSENFSQQVREVSPQIEGDFQRFRARKKRNLTVLLEKA